MKRDQAAMNDPKPFAALTGTLLARKGAARPAMRPQVSLDWADTDSACREEPARPARMALVPGARLPEVEQPEIEQPEIDRAWTDMGEPLPEPSVAEAGEENPEVLRQIRQLSGMINRKVAATRRANADVETLPGKKVAFTLRLDPRRHALLRACCTAERRSAQALLVEALDRLVDATPGLEDIVAQLAASGHAEPSR
jgi:hypothetical protein